MSERITIGRRIPLAPDGTIRLWPREPGDYVGPVTGYTGGGVPAVFFLKPNARDADAVGRARSIQHVVSPPHEFRECPDGSLEIRASISDLATGHVGPSDGWHGYLDEGHVWRQV